MATPGQLIDAFADALALPRSLVEANYRSLRTEGRVTKGGRGRSAPTSTPKDAAALLIALLASETAVNADQAFMEFASLPLLVVLETEVGPGASLPSVDMSDFDKPSQFADGLILLLSEFPRFVAELDRVAQFGKRRIAVETHLGAATAEIRLGSTYAHYESMGSGMYSDHAMVTQRSVGERSLAIIYECLHK
jgi:hypothetical protein